MRIAVLLDRARVFRWHLALIEALKAHGADVTVRFRRTSDPLPTLLTAILDFDRARGHTSADRFATHMAPEALRDLKQADGMAVDVTLDLSAGNTIARQTGPVVRPLYDGSVKDYALFHALLDRKAPQLAIWHSDYKHVFVIGQPARDDPLVLSRSFDQVISRLIEGLVRFFGGGPQTFQTAPPPSATSSAAEPMALSAMWYALARGRKKLRRASHLFSGNAPRWSVAWRAMDAIAPTSGVVALARYKVIDDGGSRMFSDPHLFCHDGVTHCFVTETPEATGIAAIAHLTLSGSGGSDVTTVLRKEDGLRRPCVFAFDGDIWLIGDTTEGGVDLYRARHFPDDWVFEKRLISAALHAPEFFANYGRFWIFGTSPAYQSSLHDGLTLYWADTLLGPWRAHERNPVLIDAACAEAAGALWRDGTTIMRLGQDHASKRGGINSKQVLRLSENVYDESTAGHIGFAARSGLTGPMMLARAGGFEALDFYASPSAVRAALKGSAREQLRD